jgi:toxin ParE1/3/4
MLPGRAAAAHWRKPSLVSCGSNAKKLAGLPGVMGRARPELRTDIRSFPHKGYVIFFRYTGDFFEVINVLEGHRDIEAFFSDNDG